MNNSCSSCFREIDQEEPFTSFDFVTNRSAGDHVHVLEGRELMRFWIVLRSAVALLAAMNATDLGARSDARDVGAWVDLVSLGER